MARDDEEEEEEDGAVAVLLAAAGEDDIEAASPPVLALDALAALAVASLAFLSGDAPPCGCFPATRASLLAWRAALLARISSRRDRPAAPDDDGDANADRL